MRSWLGILEEREAEDCEADVFEDAGDVAGDWSVDGDTEKSEHVDQDAAEAGYCDVVEHVGVDCFASKMTLGKYTLEVIPLASVVSHCEANG